MVGDFSYGEIGADTPEHCDFHNETCSLVALKEIRTERMRTDLDGLRAFIMAQADDDPAGLGAA